VFKMKKTPIIRVDGTRSRTSLREVKERMDEIETFSGTPLFVTEIRNGYLYVCYNDGQWTTDSKKSGKGGYATFVGKFTPDEVIRKFLEKHPYMTEEEQKRRKQEY
jgi:hypothetical protein